MSKRSEFLIFLGQLFLIIGSMAAGGIPLFMFVFYYPLTAEHTYAYGLISVVLFLLWLVEIMLVRYIIDSQDTE